MLLAIYPKSSEPLTPMGLLVEILPELLRIIPILTSSIQQAEIFLIDIVLSNALISLMESLRASNVMAKLHATMP
jgi:hypothetical protein